MPPFPMRGRSRVASLKNWVTCSTWWCSTASFGSIIRNPERRSTLSIRKSRESACLLERRPAVRVA